MDPSILPLVSLQRRRDLVSVASALEAAKRQVYASSATALARQIRSERNPAKLGGLALTSASVRQHLQAAQYKEQALKQFYKKLEPQIKSSEASLRKKLQAAAKLQRAQVALLDSSDPFGRATAQRIKKLGHLGISAATYRGVRNVSERLSKLEKNKKKK